MHKKSSTTLKINALAASLAGVLATLCAGCGAGKPGRPPPVTITELEHPLWGRVVRLANNEIEAVVAPERGGRLMHYSRTGQPNLLWTAADMSGGEPGLLGGWKNWGGEKSWLWPQEAWKTLAGRDWPPLHEMEQAAYTPAKIHDGFSGVAFTSPRMAAFSSKLVRTFSLDRKGTTLRIHATLEQDAPSVPPVSLWSVVQVPTPKEIRVEFVPPGRLVPQDEKNAEVLRFEGTRDGTCRVAVLQKPASTKYFGDFDRFLIDTPQGCLCVAQKLDDARLAELEHGGYADVYRGQVYKSQFAGADDYTELEFAAPLLPGAGPVAMTVELSLK